MAAQDQDREGEHEPERSEDGPREAPTSAASRTPEVPSPSPALDPRLTRFKLIAKIVESFVTSIAIIVAGGWAFYTFVYKEIRVPRSELGHLSGRADLRIVAAKGRYKAVQASIFVKNNSRKTVKLLPGLVEVVGYRFLGPIQTGSIENVPWRSLEGAQRPVVTRFDTGRETKVLMASDPMRNIDLGAGEERSDTVIFHVDEQCCDYMDLFVYTPFVYNDFDFDAEWDIVAGNHVATYYHTTGGKRQELTSDEMAKLLRANTFDVMQLRHSLSLWPEWSGEKGPSLEQAQMGDSRSSAKAARPVVVQPAERSSK